MKKCWKKCCAILFLLIILPGISLAQGVNPVHPVKPNGSALFPTPFASADNIAAQTATAMHGLAYIWDGSAWDRWTGAVTQSGTWTVQPGNTANTTPWLFSLSQTGTNNDVDAAISNFPTTASTSAVSIRCVNTAGNAFEACGGSGGSGGTSSNFASAFPSAGTAAGFTDGTNMVAGRVVTSAPASGDAGLVVRNISPTTVATGAAVPASAAFVAGTDGTNARALKTDTGGELQIDVLTLPALPTGSNTIGTVNIGTFPDNEPVNIAQMNGVAVSMGNGASGTGTQRVTIANDSTGTVTVTQGTGTNLHVVCDSGCSSSAGFADNSAFTFGTTAINPIGGVLDDTATNAATENSAAVARITAQKALHMNLRNNSGTEVGTSGAPLRTDPTGTTTQPVSGTVTANAGTGTFNIQANASTNLAQVNGNSILTGAGNTGTGSPRVTIATDQAALPGMGVYVEDAAETAGGNISMSGTVRRDTAASSAATTGRNATLNTDATGLLWTRNIDPCSALSKTFLPINITTAATTEITPSLAGASTNYYVCSLVLFTAAANNVALVDDDTDGCVSVTSGMAGGTTAASGFNFAANSGMTFGNGMGAVFKTNGTNRVVCLVTSAATQLSGTMSVVAAP